MGTVSQSLQITMELSLVQAQPLPKGLLALPTEILLLIMKELEWDDILNLRMVSHNKYY